MEIYAYDLMELTYHGWWSLRQRKLHLFFNTWEKQVLTSFRCKIVMTAVAILCRRHHQCMYMKGESFSKSNITFWHVRGECKNNLQASQSCHIPVTG
uniref:Uncharacterized protein n=1 Tax=Anguilla anguilla TaxID=7936 RepID=A0A0E9PAU8_ANGAN